MFFFRRFTGSVVTVRVKGTLQTSTCFNITEMKMCVFVPSNVNNSEAELEHDYNKFNSVDMNLTAV